MGHSQRGRAPTLFPTWVDLPDVISLSSLFFFFSSSLHPWSYYFHSTTPRFFTMASALKLGTSTLRSSIAAKPAVQSAAFNGLRAYSTGKAKVRCLIWCFSGTSMANWHSCIIVSQGDLRRQAPR